MARRVFLHVGTPKSGTTYLQTVMWANKRRLRKQQLLLPLERFHAHFHLSSIARQAPVQLARMGPQALGAWERMVTQVSRWNGDVLISHELFAYTSAERVRWTVEQLTELCDEVHIVVTARDFGRQVPAEWQETIKHGGVYGLHEYYELVRLRSPKVGFWNAQDLVRLLTDWGAGLPPEHVHLVTLPPKGAPPDLLLNRFAGLIGVDPQSFDTTISRPNESLGLVEIETLRRCNMHAPESVVKTSKNHLTRSVLADGILAQRPDPLKFAPSEADHAWAVEVGTEIVEKLRSLPYDVVGDLNELVPVATREPGASPDDVTDAEVAAVAVETVPALLFGLGEELAEARQAYNDERNLGLTTHVRRNLGKVKRKLLRQTGG